MAVGRALSASLRKSAKMKHVHSPDVDTLMFPIRMTASNKIEQFFTGRPNSMVPGKTMCSLFGLAPRDDTQMQAMNMIMHFGQGALAGAIRAGMSSYGVRGPFGDLIFVGIRLSIDQTLENWTGVGAPPWYVLVPRTDRTRH